MQASTYTPDINTQQTFKRNLEKARLFKDENSGLSKDEIYDKYKNSLKEEINKKEAVQKLQKIGKEVSDYSDIYEKYKNSPMEDMDKKEVFNKIQKKAEEHIKDEELKKMMKGASRIMETRGSKTKMTFEVMKLAIESREALNDYHSKWWLIHFGVAIVKEFADFSWFIGVLLSIWLFFALFGGGFVKKRLRKIIWKMAILFILGLIPGVSAAVPESVLAVYLRWSGSKKEAEKGERDLAQIKKKHPDYEI